MRSEGFIMAKPRLPKMLGQGHKLRKLERFDKVGIRAALKGSFFLVREFGSGQYYDRQTVKPCLLADPAQECQTVRRRQPQIQYYQVRSWEMRAIFVRSFVFQILLG